MSERNHFRREAIEQSPDRIVVVESNARLACKALLEMKESMAGNAGSTNTPRGRGHMAFNFVYRDDTGEILGFSNYRSDFIQGLSEDNRRHAREASFLLANDTRKASRFLSGDTDSFPTSSSIENVFYNTEPSSTSRGILNDTVARVNTLLSNEFNQTALPVFERIKKGRRGE